MKTQKMNNTKKILIVSFIALGLFLTIPFGFGMYAGDKLFSGITGKIDKAINDNCNCESVRLDFTSFGIQYSKENGFSNQRALYVLKNCEYKGSATDEANRINEGLKNSIENYDALDVIELLFQSNSKEELVTIKDGKILK